MVLLLLFGSGEMEIFVRSLLFYAARLFCLLRPTLDSDFFWSLNELFLGILIELPNEVLESEPGLPICPTNADGLCSPIFGPLVCFCGKEFYFELLS